MHYLFNRNAKRGYPTTHNKDKSLHTNPHYTDERFNEEQTIFGKPARGGVGHRHLQYDYSDRLWEWDYDKHEKAVEAANQSNANSGSCLWYEAYLTAYFDKPITVEHIIAGVNKSNGYSYLVFGYKYK